MTTLKDVVQFYKTPIDTRTPLDKMRTMELPENLHVQFEYHRFHPGKKKEQYFKDSLDKVETTYGIKLFAFSVRKIIKNTLTFDFFVGC